MMNTRTSKLMAELDIIEDDLTTAQIRLQEEEDHRERFELGRLIQSLVSMRDLTRSRIRKAEGSVPFEVF